MNEESSSSPPPPPPEDDDETNQTYYRPDLPNSIYALVKKLWTLLVRKDRGYLRVADFVRLGQAMSEEKPTVASAEFMLEQANISGTGRVDRDEWMGYCERLKRMPEELGIAQLTAFIARLETINAKELRALEQIAKKGDMAEAREEEAMEREIQRMVNASQGKSR